MKPSIPSPFALLRESWEFFRKQSALLQVYAWLLALPAFLCGLLAEQLPKRIDATTASDEKTLLVSLSIVVLLLIMLWGTAGVLLVGKRLLQSKAGRTRTSFKAVRKQAREFVLPLLLTSILSLCLVLLWSILLIVPGIWYAVIAMLAQVVVVGEGIAYRPALHRASEAVRGHWVPISLRIVAVALILVTPVLMIEVLLEQTALTATAAGSAAYDAIDALLKSFAYTLFLLCLIQIYAARRKALSRFEEVIPDPIEQRDNGEEEALEE